MMSGLIPDFAPEIPGALVVPVHETNMLRCINHPKVLVLHTPEEPSDDVEVTPHYFQTPNLGASTHWYQDSDGDLYQMVPTSCGAIANGVRNKPYPYGTDPAISLNYQSESNEIEGYAATISQTMPRGGRQWKGTVRWVVLRAIANDIVIERRRVIGHYEVADNRTDPGTLNIDQIVEDAQEEYSRMEEEIRALSDRVAELEQRLPADLFNRVRKDAVLGKNRSWRNEQKGDGLIQLLGHIAERVVGTEKWQEYTEAVVAKLHPPDAPPEDD